MAVAGGGSGADPNTIYPHGSTVQGYIDTNGTMLTRQIEYPLGILQFGAASIAQFSSGSLPLFIADLDGVGRISILDDYRPA